VEKMFGKEKVDLEWSLKSAKKNKEEMMASYLRMKRSDRIPLAVNDLEHATRSGYHGAASDSVLEASTTWGEDMDRCFGERVVGERAEVIEQESRVLLSVWHGTDDHDVPIAAGDYLAERLRPTSYHRIDGESHTLIRRSWPAILREAVENGSRGGGGHSLDDGVSMNEGKL
jgi:hypothetical protein